MKSTIFREVLNEEFIEVDRSVPETIQYLREQSGTCHFSTSNDIRIYFECSKKGKLFVSSNVDAHRGVSELGHIYCVYGNVICKNNKTYIKITSVNKKFDVWLRRLLLILVIPIFIVKICLEGHLYIPALLCSFIVLIIGMIDLINTTSIQKNRGLEIVELMENEIKRRVRNIERWDD